MPLGPSELPTCFLLCRPRDLSSGRFIPIVDPEVSSEIQAHRSSILRSNRTNAYTSGHIHRNHTDDDETDSVFLCQCAERWVDFFPTH